MCPKCGTWYVPGNHYDQTVSNSQSTIYDCRECKDVRDTPGASRNIYRNPPKRQGAGRKAATVTSIDLRKYKRILYTITIVILMIVAGVYNGLKSSYTDNTFDDDEYYDEYNYDELYDNMLLGYRNTNITLTSVGEINKVYDQDEGWLYYKITDIKASSLKDMYIPEGYELITVKYTLSDSDGFDLDSSNNPSIYINTTIVPYVRTKTGVILEPLNTYEMSELIEADDSFGYMEDNELEQYMCNSKGTLLYLVKEGDYDCIIIQSVNDEYVEDSSTELHIIGGSEETVDAISAKHLGTDSKSAYYIDPDVYVKKIEKNSVFTPSEGVSFKLSDIILPDFEGDNEVWDDGDDDDEWDEEDNPWNDEDLWDSDESVEELYLSNEKYDFYLVAVNMTNYTSREYTYPYIMFEDSDWSYVTYSEIPYSSVQEYPIIPSMTTSTEYYVLALEKGYRGTITCTYDNLDSEYEGINSQFDFYIE